MKLETYMFVLEVSRYPVRGVYKRCACHLFRNYNMAIRYTKVRVTLLETSPATPVL